MGSKKRTSASAMNCGAEAEVPVKGAEEKTSEPAWFDMNAIPTYVFVKSVNGAVSAPISTTFVPDESAGGLTPAASIALLISLAHESTASAHTSGIIGSLLRMRSAVSVSLFNQISSISLFMYISFWSWIADRAFCFRGDSTTLY